MRLSDTKFIGCANLSMRLHQCRSLRGHDRVVCKDPLPPDIETSDVGIQTRTKPWVVLPISRSRELAALWVELLSRIHLSFSDLVALEKRKLFETDASCVAPSLDRGCDQSVRAEAKSSACLSHEKALKVRARYRNRTRALNMILRYTAPEHLINWIQSFLRYRLTIAMATLMAAARAFGLGVVPIGGIRRDPQAIIDLLRLPPNTFPVDGVVLGYIEGESLQKPRMAIESFCHEETYHPEVLTPAIDAYDRTILEYWQTIGCIDELSWSANVAEQYSTFSRSIKSVAQE